MKRLMKYLREAFKISDSNLTQMYQGVISLPSYGGYSDSIYDPTYWYDDNSYIIQRPHKLSLDCPEVTVCIPLENLINQYGKDDALMKRLKDYLLHMEPNNSTYKDMYEGKMIVPVIYYENNEVPMNPPLTDRDTDYWYKDEIAFHIERPHKLSLDCPEVTVKIPTYMMNLNEVSDVVSDYCMRAFIPYIDDLNAELYNRSRPDNENGKYYIYKPGGKVIFRNGAYFKMCNTKYYQYKGAAKNDKNPSLSGGAIIAYDDYNPDGAGKNERLCLCIQLQVQLPMRKHKKAIQMLTRDLPEAVDNFIMNFDHMKLKEAIQMSALQQSIRSWLKTSDYCAFVANGSLLPRLGGTDLPYTDGIPFKSPPENEIEIMGIKGMGIRKGVTVITGGGYSGKSTLLDALSAGIYNHIVGDGRELVITDETAVKISAEDGRAVRRADLSPFIKWIPGGNPSDFSTDHASGSTSQAANIMEAIESDSKTMLIDEDISATNFMIRDSAMKELITREPITPFTERVKELHISAGVSTILVIGGSGEYLSVADTVIMMDSFMAYNTTDTAKAIAKKRGIVQDIPEKAEWKYKRMLKMDAFTTYPENSGTEILTVSDLGFIIFGDEKIDIRMLHNIVSSAQITSMAYILRAIALSCSGRGIIDIDKEIDDIYEKLRCDGIDTVYTNFFAGDKWMELPRKCEVKAVVNRMRKISFKR